ncbi:MAG: response regulator [Planctomycetes bacterium]|nr:response regulator [Planctomycetota bacterium]
MVRSKLATKQSISALLVEDDLVSSAVIQDGLSAVAPEMDLRLDITHVTNLADGCRKLSSCDFDFILLDLHLPDSLGIDTVRRTSAAAPTRPIVVLSANDHMSDAVNAIQAGATDYVVKGQLKPMPLMRLILQAIERKRLEVAMHDYECRLRSALQDLEVAKNLAEEGNRAKSRFLASMSHEIRTPMAAILGFAEVLLDNLEKAENIEAIETIARNGNYLLELINDILDLSKIEAGKIDVELVPFVPLQIIEDTVSLMGNRARAKGIELVTECDSPLPQTIQSDPTRLRQILVNLIGNAIKFTEQGSVRLITRLVHSDDNNSKLQFDVIDTGIGMTAEQMEQLFKPFVQGDASTTRKYGGTGLGLTISKRLVELLGGTITVNSKAGHGSTFRVTIPAKCLDEGKLLANSPDDHSRVAQIIQPAASTPPRLDCRVLLAEDNPDNQRLISFLLKKAGADVTTVGNGLLAVEAVLAAEVSNQPFDLVLMDMQMPVLDGYDATQKLRAEGYRGPIVALSAHALQEYQQKCLDAGCDEYMSKPFDREQLLSVIERHTCDRFKNSIILSLS